MTPNSALAHDRLNRKSNAAAHFEHDSVYGLCLACRVIEAKQQYAESGLPEEAVLHVNNECFMVPEALFCPSDINVDQAGVCETIANSIHATHPVFRPLLAQNVLLIGGTSSCPGFKERVRKDLRPLLDTHYHMRVNQGEDPAMMAWHGASICGSSGMFRSQAVSKSMYAEQGSYRVAVSM
jgi:actin-related protein 6